MNLLENSPDKPMKVTVRDVIEHVEKRWGVLLLVSEKKCEIDIHVLRLVGGYGFFL